jgi:hypothetical protein
MARKQPLVIDASKMKYVDMTTKKARIEFMRQKLKTDDLWMLKGLLTIYGFQTEEEKHKEETVEHNGVGFAGNDAEFLTSLAKRLIARGVPTIIADRRTLRALDFLSPKQEAILRNKMHRYAGQLVRLTAPVTKTKAEKPKTKVKTSTSAYLKASRGE